MINNKTVGKGFLVLLLFLLPFFEGCDSAEGLLVAHGILAALAVLQIFRKEIYTGSAARLPVCFIIYCALAVIFSEYMYGSFLAFLKLVFPIVLFFAVLSLDISPAFLTKAVLLSCSLQGIIVLGQLWRRIASLDGGNMPGNFMNFSGGFLHSGHLAIFLSIGLALAVGFPGKKRPAPAGKLLPVAASLLCISGIFLTRSRVGLLSVLIIIGMAAVMRSGKKVTVLVICAALLIPAGAYIVVKQKSADPYRFDRIEIWRSSLETWEEKPVFGWGPGNFEFGAARHNFPNRIHFGRYGKFIKSADSGYIEMLAELGIVGFLLFAALVAGIFLKATRSGKQKDGLLTALAVFFFAALFHGVFLSTALTFLIAILLAAGLKGTIRIRRTEMTMNTPLALFTAVVVFYGSVAAPYLAHRYFRMMSRPENNLKAYNRAVFFNPYQPYYHQAMARMLISGEKIPRERFTYADRLLEKAVNLNSLEPRFYFDRAKLLTRFSRQYGAFPGTINSIEELYRKSLERAPYNVFLVVEKARFHLWTGDIQKGTAFIDHALELEPYFLNALLLRIKILLLEDHRGQAVELFREFRKRAEEFRRDPPVNDYERQLGEVREDLYREVRELIIKEKAFEKES